FSPLYTAGVSQFTTPEVAANQYLQFPAGVSLNISTSTVLASLQAKALNFTGVPDFFTLGPPASIHSFTFNQSISALGMGANSTATGLAAYTQPAIWGVQTGTSTTKLRINNASYSFTAPWANSVLTGGAIAAGAGVGRYGNMDVTGFMVWGSTLSAANYNNAAVALANLSNTALQTRTNNI